jgi:hypothetical protein
MEETAPRRNNLSLLFLHLGVAPTGGVGGRGVMWPGLLAGLQIW